LKLFCKRYNRIRNQKKKKKRRKKEGPRAPNRPKTRSGPWPSKRDPEPVCPVSPPATDRWGSLVTLSFSLRLETFSRMAYFPAVDAPIRPKTLTPTLSLPGYKAPATPSPFSLLSRIRSAARLQKLHVGDPRYCHCVSSIPTPRGDCAACFWSLPFSLILDHLLTPSACQILQPNDHSVGAQSSLPPEADSSRSSASLQDVIDRVDHALELLS
jgi:hypothetical protein